MTARLLYLWDQVRNSYWFLPGLMTLVAIALSFGMIRLDQLYSLDALESLGWLIYTGGVEGAREVLGIVAGSMITVAGVVFSITIVALSLASSQFGPRVLSNFMRDQGNQVVLGTFIATYIYSLLVLRIIESGTDTSEAVVPHLSVTASVVLALLSLGVLIYFIHHVAVSIQAPTLIAGIAHDLRDGIARLFPEGAGVDAAGRPESFAARLPTLFEREAAAVLAPGDGYLEAVDLSTLMALAAERAAVIRLEWRPGQFVVCGAPLARVFPPSAVDDELLETVAGAFVIGARRTALQDLEFPIHQLVEVAVRALSPGINDPFTALSCIDQIGAGLCRLAGRAFPSPYRVDGTGELRLVVARPLTFAGVLDSALNQIRQNAAHHVTIHIRLLETVAKAVPFAATAERVDLLLAHAGMTRRAALATVPAPEDREEIEGRHRILLEVAAGRRAELGTGGAG